MSFDPDKINFFAKTDARGQQIAFGIKAKDRQRHMYVVGKTGMGKSTLLENMAAQDIQSGEGMAFIDPHGSAAETLLDYVPEHRINDVIYFAPFDMANPISFNVMEDVGIDKRHLVVSGLMSTFKKIWVDAWSARMEYILTNALLALIEYPDTTLLSVNRLFSDKAYRTQVVNYIKDPAVKAFWTEEFANYTDRFAAEALPAIQNKIGQFTGNPLIRNIIGQPHSSFDIRDIMDNKKILIMNLSKGLVGETNANLLGSMLTTRIYLAAMSRADIPVEKMKTMPNFYFYVDEFQSFANSTFANILSEARKYHLNLIIAHQYIEQMEEEVRSAVFGNVGTTIAFRVGPFDAEVLETVFTPRFVAADLVNLGFAQIYLTLMIDGIGSQPFSAVTLPPVVRLPVSFKNVVLEASRKNYTKSREEVEKIVADLHTPVKVEPPVKKNNYSNNSNPKTEYKPKILTEEKKSDDKKIEPPVIPDVIKNDIPTTTVVPAPEVMIVPKISSSDIVKNYNSPSPSPSPTSISTSTNSNYKTTKPIIKESFDKNKTYKDKQSQSSLSDLRGVLSKISSNTNNKIPSGESSGVVRKVEKGKPETPDLRSTLASLLEKNNLASIKPVVEKVTLSVVESDISHIEIKRQEDRKELEKLHAEVESTFNDLEKSERIISLEEVVVKSKNKTNNHHRQKSHVAPQHNKFEPRIIKQKKLEAKNDPLEPRKIQKKLRQPHKERSPFAS